MTGIALASPDPRAAHAEMPGKNVDVDGEVMLGFNDRGHPRFVLLGRVVPEQVEHVTVHVGELELGACHHHKTSRRGDSARRSHQRPGATM
jgi:hypothetical protein